MGFLEWLGKKINEGIAWFERKTGVDIPFVGTNLSKERKIKPASYSTTISKQQAKEIEKQQKQIKELAKKISLSHQTAPSPKLDNRKIGKIVDSARWKEVTDPREAVEIAAKLPEQSSKTGYIPAISKIEKREKIFKSTKTYYIDESGIYEGNKLVQKFEKPKPKYMSVPYVVDYTKRTVYFPTSAKRYITNKVLPEDALKRGWRIEFKDLPQHTPSSKQRITIILEQKLDFNKLADYYKNKGYKVSFENGKLKVEVPIEHKYVEYRITPYPFKSYYEYEEALKKERIVQDIVQETMRSPNILAQFTKIVGPRFTPVDPFGFRTVVTFVGGIAQRKPMEKIAEEINQINKEGVEYVTRLYMDTKNSVLAAGRFTLESPVAQLGFAILGGEALGVVATKVPSVRKVLLNPTFQKVSLTGYASFEASKLYYMKVLGFSNEQIIAEAGKDVIHAIGFGIGFKHVFESFQPKVYRVKLFSGIEEQRLRIVSESPEVNKILNERFVGYKQVKQPKFLKDVMHASEIERLKASYQIKLGVAQIGGKKLYFTDIYAQRPIISEITTIQKPEIQEWINLKGVRAGGKLFGQDILTGKRIRLDVWKSLMVPVGEEEFFKPVVIRGKLGKMKPFYFPKGQKPTIPKVDNSLIYERAELAFLGERLNLVMKGEIPLKYSTSSSQKLLLPKHKAGFVKWEPIAVPISATEVKPVVLRISTSTTSTALLSHLKPMIALKTVEVHAGELKLKTRTLTFGKPDLAFRLKEFLSPKIAIGSSLKLDLKNDILPKQTITITTKTTSRLDLSFWEDQLTSQKIGIRERIKTRYSSALGRISVPKIPRIGLGKIGGSVFEKYFLGYGRRKRKKRKVGIKTMSDLFSIEESILKFGKATIPSGKIAKMKFLNVNIFGRFPTFELMKRRIRRI